MKAINKIIRRFLKTISVAATCFDKTRKPKVDRISQRYTADWRELVCAKC